MGGRRYWTRMVAASLIAAVAVVVVFGGVGLRTPARDTLNALLVALTFSTCIGPLMAAAMPRAGRYFWRYVPFPFNWVVALALMIAIAMVGSALAIGVLIAVGRVPAPQFAAAFRGTLRPSIIITLVFGVFVTAYEVMRARVDRANAQAQLASLEARVQPHFLFNTLNSIAALIHDDPRGAEAMTGRLATLLRSSLDRDDPLVALGDELDTVQAYLDIERVRFGERLRYAIVADDGARAARIPRFAVQTLVENSVKYAVSPRRDGGRIDVRAAADGSRLQVAVEDDGPGFDAAVDRPGHGLALLRDRLDSLFGRAATLRIDSGPRGTIVRIEVPR